MAVRKIKENTQKRSLREASEGQDYTIWTMTMDVAVPKGGKITGVSADSGPGSLYNEISNILSKHGYEMAGDFIDTEKDEVNTQLYKDNDVEFFTESLDEESKEDTKVRGHVTTWSIRETDDDRYLVTPGNKTYPTLEKAKQAIKIAEDNYVKANPKCKVANKEIWADHGTLWVDDIDGGYYKGEETL